jgi:ABC-type transport system involved in multi-copper enzyme maturation permease subunit
MTVLWPVIAVTFKEGIRNRSFYGISLFALLLLAGDFLIAGMVPRDVGKVAVDFALSAVSFSGLLLVLFVGINLIAKDLDRRTIYMVLARPITRSQYILGKFFGMSLLIVTAVLFLGSSAVLSIATLLKVYPNYFSHFSWPIVFLALCFIALSLVLLSALSFLFASFASTSFVTLALTVIAYLIGNSLADVKALVENPGAVGIQVAPLTLKTVQAAYYLFPNLSFFDLKLQAAHGIPVAASYVFWTALYGLLYTCLVVALAALIFRKKEFP